MSVSPNKPPLDTMKRSILNFVRGLVPFWLYRDFQFLLSPCCTNTATLTFTCAGLDVGGDPIYNVTMTFSTPLDLPNGVLIPDKFPNGVSVKPVAFTGSSYTWSGITGLSSGTGTFTISYASVPSSDPNALIDDSTGLGQGIPIIGYIFNGPYTIPTCPK